MNLKKIRYRLVAIILITSVILAPAGNIYGAEKKNLPRLIQTTTLEDDYRALALLELAVTPLLSEEDFQRAFENVLCSSVRIQTREHYGSGNIYKMLEDEIIIVTNRHVLQDWDEDSCVTFFNGAAGIGEILGISEEADVGFISIPTAGFPYSELLTFRNIRISKEKAERFFCIDMANYFETPVIEYGEILSFSIYLEDFGMEMMYGQGSAAPGMSGSGLFDGFGNYLGMLTGATQQGEIAAVSGETVNREYEKIRGRS